MVPVGSQHGEGNDAHPVELRDATAAQRWLSAGLCLLRTGKPSPEALRPAASWLLAALTEHPSLPPPGFLVDVGRLLDGAHLELSSAFVPEERRLRSALRGYEDQLLGRLAADPLLTAAGDAVARLGPELRPAAVGLFSASVLERIGFRGGIAVQPAVARRGAQRSAEEILEEGLGVLREPSATTALLADGYEALVRAAQRARSLVADAEVFALENLTVLRSLSQRLSIQQIVEVAEALSQQLPRRLARRAQPTGSAATQLEDESQYPVGGFSSMSTSGSLENIVTSELIYMNDGSEEGRRLRRRCSTCATSRASSSTTRATRPSSCASAATSPSRSPRRWSRRATRTRRCSGSASSRSSAWCSAVSAASPSGSARKSCACAWSSSATSFRHARPRARALRSALPRVAQQGRRRGRRGHARRRWRARR